MRVLDHFTSSTTTGSPVFSHYPSVTLPVFLEQEFDVQEKRSNEVNWTIAGPSSLHSTKLKALRVRLVPFDSQIAGPRQIEAVFHRPSNGNPEDSVEGAAEVSSLREPNMKAVPTTPQVTKNPLQKSSSTEECDVGATKTPGEQVALPSDNSMTPSAKSSSTPARVRRKRTLTYYSPTICAHTPGSGITNTQSSTNIASRKRMKERLAKLRGVVQHEDVAYDVNSIHEKSICEGFSSTANRLDFS